jgi:hypothetical protein
MEKGITINWENPSDDLSIARVGRDGPTAVEVRFNERRGLWQWKLLGIPTDIHGEAVERRDACHVAGAALIYVVTER